MRLARRMNYYRTSCMVLLKFSLYLVIPKGSFDEHAYTVLRKNLISERAFRTDIKHTLHKK